jgi:trehalose 6-phosphate phosphatase
VTASLLARLAAEPARAAILLDVDGTLAPIVRHPEAASVPPAARSELERLARRYALVGCVSGRPSADVRRLVGVEGVTYVGLHGLELDHEAARYERAIHAFAETVDWPREDKGLAVSYHYREAADQEAARRQLEDVAARARAAGLHARFGRKVLEILPPVEANKGTAVRRLLERARLSRALYAGDDRTDLDAFRALDGIELGVRVAVASDEAPNELRETADVVVDGPAELLELLRRL